MQERPPKARAKVKVDLVIKAREASEVKVNPTVVQRAKVALVDPMVGLGTRMVPTVREDSMARTRTPSVRMALPMAIRRRPAQQGTKERHRRNIEVTSSRTPHC